MGSSPISAGDTGDFKDSGGGEIQFGKNNAPRGEEDATTPDDPNNPYLDLKAASERIDKLLVISRYMRPQFERDWFRNLLFFCLDGDTRIRLLDGRTLTLRELSLEPMPVWALGFDIETSRVIPAKIDRVWATGTKPCIKLNFDVGGSLTLTKEHELLTWFKGYKKAGDLTPDDRLVPVLYSQRDGYQAIYQACETHWEMTHRMVWAHQNGRRPKKSFHIHHRNDVRADNRPENLQELSPMDHYAETRRTMGDEINRRLRASRQSPSSREKSRRAAKRQWQSKREKMVHAHRSLRTQPEYLANLQEGVSAFWSDPAKREKRCHAMRASWAKRRENKIANHRVISVEDAGEREVFDFTVSSTSNVVLDCGVIAHNCGVQWIIEDRGRWRPRNLPTWFPRSMTNKFAEKVNDLCSTLLQNERTPINYLPSTDDPEDKAIAEISTTIRDVMYEEAGVEEWEEELARWVVICGNGFLHPYYDMDEEHGVTKLPKLQCTQCKAVFPPENVDPTVASSTPNEACPQCQSGPLSVAKDENGATLQQSYPIGRYATKCLSPFEIHIDHRVRRWSQHRRFAWMELVDVDEVKEEFAPTDDRRQKIVADDSNTDLGMFYLESMAQITSSYGRSASLPGGISSTASQRQPKTLKYHYFELPSEKYPEGLHAVRVGTSQELVTVCEPLPDKYGSGPRQGRPFLPLVQFGFDVSPGRAWAKTRMDDLIALQMFRNIIDANLRITVQRMGNSIWMNPKGSGVSIFTGVPGQVIGYNPISFGGSSFAKPERVPPDLSGVAGLIALLNKIDDGMERVAGTQFVQGGDVPPGVTAASALAFLSERAQRSLSTFARSWAKSWKLWEEFGLEIYREHATNERVMSVVGKNKSWEINKFTNAELTGSVRMLIDYNGLFPKSLATERATIAQLAQMMFIQPGDQEMDRRVLEKFGESDLKPSTDLDTREAVKENEAFMDAADQAIKQLLATPNEALVDPQAQQQVMQTAQQSLAATLQFVPLVQNSTIHMEEHTNLCKTEEFKLLPDAAKQIMYAHIEIHANDLQAQAAAAGAGEQAGQEAGAAAGGKGAAGDKGKSAGPQGPDGTKKVQNPRQVGPPDLLGAAMEPQQPAAVGAGQ